MDKSLDYKGLTTIPSSNHQNLVKYLTHSWLSTILAKWKKKMEYMVGTTNPKLKKKTEKWDSEFKLLAPIHLTN